MDLLVVDDDKDYSDTLADWFEGLGWDVIQVEGSREAIAVLKGWNMTVVLCDVYMPEGDGVELARWKYHYRPKLPVIMLSGSNSVSLSTVADVLHVFKCPLVDKLTPLDSLTTLVDASI